MVAIGHAPYAMSARRQARWRARLPTAIDPR
jgi:hypothetical protein